MSSFFFSIAPLPQAYLYRHTTVSTLLNLFPQPRTNSSLSLQFCTLLSFRMACSHLYEVVCHRYHIRIFFICELIYHWKDSGKFRHHIRGKFMKNIETFICPKQQLLFKGKTNISGCSLLYTRLLFFRVYDYVFRLKYLNGT